MNNKKSDTKYYVNNKKFSDSKLGNVFDNYSKSKGALYKLDNEKEEQKRLKKNHKKNSSNDFNSI